MKLVLQLIGIIIIFFLGMQFQGMIDQKFTNIKFNDYIPALVTLLAAFLGARYAFSLQNEKIKRDQIQSNVAAGNKAVFLISRQINELDTIKEQIIDPERNQDIKFLTIRPFFLRDLEHLKFDTDALSFLLQTDHRELLSELTIEEARFQQTINAVNRRSHLHLKEIQPLLEKAGFIEGNNYTISFIRDALGDRIFTSLQRATDDMIHHVDKTLDTLTVMVNKLSNSLSEIYPKEKFSYVDYFKKTNN